MAILKQSTARVRVFKMIDSADHFSKKTGAAPAVQLSKNGGGFGAAGGAVAEIAQGWYSVSLNTTDTNTLGDLAFFITGTGADDTDFVDQVTVRGLDDLAFPATSGRSLAVDTAGAVTLSNGVTHGGSTAILQLERGIIASTTAGQPGLSITGNTTGAGILATGGASGHGISAVGGGTTGDGIRAAAATSGAGITATGVGTTQHGINATGGATSSDGIRATGGGVGHGINAQSGSGATGRGINAAANSTNDHGLSATGAGTGSGITATGGSTGHGLNAASGGGATGNGINAAAASTNGHGIVAAGLGTGNGLRMTSVSGDALITVVSTSGHGATFAGTGTTKHGVNATGGATTSHGINAAGGGVGHGVNAVGGTGAASDGIRASGGSTSGIGLNAIGVGTTFPGIKGTGGATTSAGMNLVGGAVSGDGLLVSTTSGHGINLAPVGTNMHGLLATGGNGGVSDGIKGVAGTGGVDIRGNITGNITGTLTTVTTATNLTTNNDKTGYRLSATGVDDVWDEPLALHTTADTPGSVVNMLTQDTVTLSTDVALGSIVGQMLDDGTAWSYDRTTDSQEALGSASAPSAATIADAVWDEASADHVGAGSVGERVERLDIIATGGASGLSDARAVKLDNLDVAVTTRATPAQVNTEVVDVMRTDTNAELAQAIPSATPTFEQAVMLLYMALRNKLDVDATTLKVHNDAGTVVTKKVLSDDGATYSEAEMVAGP